MVDVPHNLQSRDYASGFQCDPQEIKMNRYVIDYVKQTMVKHASIYESTPAIHLATRSGKSAIKVTTPQGGITTDRLILTSKWLSECLWPVYEAIDAYRFIRQHE